MMLSGYRKFVIAGGALVGAFILALLHILTGGQFVTVVGIAVGAFHVAHAVADVTAKLAP